MDTYSVILTNSGAALLDTDDINEVIAIIKGTTGADINPGDIADNGEYGTVTDEMDSVTVRIYK